MASEGIMNEELVSVEMREAITWVSLGLDSGDVVL
jgi:hypothetical protein